MIPWETPCSKNIACSIECSEQHFPMQSFRSAKTGKVSDHEAQKQRLTVEVMCLL